MAALDEPHEVVLLNRLLIDDLTEEYGSRLNERHVLIPLLGALDVLLRALPSDNSDGSVQLDAFLLREAHVAVLLQAHSWFDQNEIAGSGTWILDTRGVVSGPKVVRL